MNTNKYTVNFLSRQMQGFKLIPVKRLVVLMLLVSLSGCHSGGDNVDPNATTTATSSGDYFSQCKVSTYTCYGNTANITALEYDSNGNPKYSFGFAMKVDNNPLQDLSVVVSLNSFSGKGTYSLTSTNAEVDYIVRTAGGDSFMSSKITGTLVITEYQPKKYVTGTFAIVSSDKTRSLELKEGAFKIESDF